MIDNTTRTTSPAAEETSSQDELLAQVLDQYLAALESGAPLDLERLVADYPRLATDIRTFAESLDVLHHATRNFRSDQPGATGE